MYNLPAEGALPHCQVHIKTCQSTACICFLFKGAKELK